MAHALLRSTLFVLITFGLTSSASADTRKKQAPVVPNFAIGAAGGKTDAAFYQLQTSKLVKSLRAENAKFRGGLSIALGDVTGDGIPELVTGAGAGTQPYVRVFNSRGKGVRTFYAFDPNFRGGVSVALGDVNGDGVNDFVLGSGSGASSVRVLDGLTLAELFNFVAFDNFSGGVNVASGDTNNDGFADIVVAQKAGGEPIVKTFSGTNLFVLSSLYAFTGTFTGGVNVAVGDVDGDGEEEIIAGAGAGGTPEIAVFSAYDNSELIRFLAFDASFAGGVFVAAMDYNADGLADIAAGTGASLAPTIRVFDSNGFVLLRELVLKKNKKKFLQGLAVAATR